MKKLVLVALIVAGCGSARTNNSSLLAPGSSLLYVCNQNDATVSIIDAATLSVVRTVDLKALGFSANAKPHHIVVEPDGRFWYVSLIGDNKVVKLDRNDRVVAQASMETPGMMALNPVSGRLFVGRSMTAVNPPPRIGIITTSSMSIDELNVLFPRPHALVADPSRGMVYTASLAVNQIAALDLGTERVELTNVPGPAHALMQFAISPDLKTLAVSAELTGRVIFFDITNRIYPRLLSEVTVEAQPFDPVFTPDGKYVVLGNKAANAITVIDAAKRSVARVIKGEGIAQPHGVVVSADSRFAYVTNNNLKGTGEHAGHAMVGGSQGTPATPAGPASVVIVDLQKLAITGVIRVGHNASGIAILNR